MVTPSLRWVTRGNTLAAWWGGQNGGPPLNAEGFPIDVARRVISCYCPILGWTVRTQDQSIRSEIAGN